MKLTSDIRTEYNWRLRKRMMSALKKNQIRNHLIVDVQREKESRVPNGILLVPGVQY
jgi:hypothetical protein